jgi:hypothetical protein
MTGILANYAIVNEDGTMTQWFRDYMNRVDRSLAIEGEGDPEGVIAAPQFSLYIDRNGASGAIEYRKMLPEIGGDRTQGWEAV